MFVGCRVSVVLEGWNGAAAEGGFESLELRVFDSRVRKV
jgi:hypothetical protein